MRGDTHSACPTIWHDAETGAFQNGSWAAHFQSMSIVSILAVQSVTLADAPNLYDTPACSAIGQETASS